MHDLDSNFEGPIYPHSIEAEQAVLGMILYSNSFAEAEEWLNAEKFYDSRHQKIFNGLKTLHDTGQPIELVSLTAHLQQTKEIREIGGVTYLAQLEGSIATSANIDHYAQIVHDRYLHRETIKKLQGQLRDAWKVDHPAEIIASMQESAATLSDQAARPKEFQTIMDVAVQTYEEIEYQFSHFEDHITGIPSGYPDLDKMTAGFQNSDLIIVAARPSVGKTAFALNISQYASIRAQKTVALFSLEMSATQLAKRMISAEGNIDATRLRTGCLESDDWERVTMAIGQMTSGKLFIDDSATQTAQEIAGKARRLKEREGLDLIVIDYLQLISGSTSARSENRQQEVSYISRTLKAIARELNIPVIALSQLSRAVEQRQDKRPTLSDLRESGAIEQDADIVSFLYRDDYYDAESEKKNIIEIIIAKQRNGPVGKVELGFLKNYNKFVSIDRNHHDSPSPEKRNGKPIPDMYRAH